MNQKDNEATSWRELLAETEARFRDAAIGVPELSARRIAEEASGLNGVELELALDSAVTKRMMAHLDSMVARRLQHEPLQYVVGSWGFRTLDVMVDARVLIPRPETEEVAGWALAEVDRLAESASFEGRLVEAADLGTGSGVIGLSLVAERDNVEVTLSDVSADALTVARSNCAGLGHKAARVVDICQGSWFHALPPSLAGRLGVIVSNPPYVSEADSLPPEVKDWEPEQALIAAADGFANVAYLVAESPAWLHPAGGIVLEMAPNQVPRAAKLAGAYFAEVEQLTDQFQRKRAISARRKL